MTTPALTRSRLLGVPAAPPVNPDPASADPAKRLAGADRGHPRATARGPRRRGSGHTAVWSRPAVYRATTAQAAGLFPLIAAPAVPPVGAYVGPDLLSGGNFFVHPVEWVRRGLVTNPNIMLFGEPGRGKSAIVKLLVTRLAAFGVRSFIAGDTKDEYAPLVRALGGSPLALGPGLPARLNPLDAEPMTVGLSDPSAPVRMAAEAAADLGARRLVLLRALLAARGYHATPTDEAALALALRSRSGEARAASTLLTPTIPDLWTALANPDPDLVSGLRCSHAGEVVDLTRHLVDALGSLVHGDLAGLFDAPTNVPLDLDAAVTSVSLSRLASRGERAVAVAMACVGAWSQAATASRRPGELTLVVRDELWRVLRLGPAMVSAVDAELRLSRSEGKIVVLAQHKPSDLLGVGDAGSQAVAIARDLMALAGTRILLGQAAGVTADLADALGLTEREQDEITGWCRGERGRALWKVGQRSFRVRAWLTAEEQRLYDTDGGLTGEPMGSRSADARGVVI